MTILNFIFIRHGHAHSNLDPGLVDTGVCLGVTERGLKEAGHAARAIAQAGVQPAHILYSPIVRAQQTAQAIANMLELEEARLQRADELRERGFGAWDGQDPEEMKNELIAGYVPEGSETREELFARLETFLERIASLSAEGPVIAVSHGGVWQGLHDMHKAEDIPWIDTGDVYALRINRVAGTIASNCLFSPSGKHAGA